MKSGLYLNNVDFKSFEGIYTYLSSYVGKHETFYPRAVEIHLID